MYTLHEELSPTGQAIASLRQDDGLSFSQVAVAPSYAAGDPTAARQALAKQIAYNMAHDRATQIVLDLSKIPRPFANLLCAQLRIEINQAAINTIVWQAAVDALTPKES